MKPILPPILLLCCLLAAAGCTGTVQVASEYAGPRGLRPRDPRAGDLRIITRLSSPDAPCPGPTVAGSEERIVQGDGIEGRLVYEGDDRSDGSLWLLRWNWNGAAFCMTGRLPAGEITKVAASIGK